MTIELGDMKEVSCRSQRTAFDKCIYDERRQMNSQLPIKYKALFASLHFSVKLLLRPSEKILFFVFLPLIAK